MLECGTYHFVHGCDSGAVYVSHLPIPIPIRLSAFLCNATFFFESAMLHAEIFGNHISYFTSGSQKCHISYLYLFFIQCSTQLKFKNFKIMFSLSSILPQLLVMLNVSLVEFFTGFIFSIVNNIDHFFSTQEKYGQIICW